MFLVFPFLHGSWYLVAVPGTWCAWWWRWKGGFFASITLLTSHPNSRHAAFAFGNSLNLTLFCTRTQKQPILESGNQTYKSVGISFFLALHVPGKGRARAFSSEAGQGEAKMHGAGRRWKSAGRGEKARKLTDPKIRQECVNCYIELFVVYYDVLIDENIVSSYF